MPLLDSQVLLWLLRLGPKPGAGDEHNVYHAC